MRIAYIISAYKCPDLLIRLIHRLHAPTSIFLIHVDRRTNKKEYEQMVSGVDHLTNVIFLTRHNCHWGDFGHVRATLKGLAFLFENKICFDYVFLLTGQDYPIKSNADISSFLASKKGNEFISYYEFPNNAWGVAGGMRRIELWHFRFLEECSIKFMHRFAHLPVNHQSTSKTKSLIYGLANLLFRKRSFPEGIKPFGGPGYWCISRGCAKYVDGFVRTNPRFVKFFRYVDIPDEIFFHTIILNSPFAKKVINDDLRCIDISAGTGPRIWQKSDLELLARSRALIARKFDTAVDTEILDLIDSTLLSRRPIPVY